MTLLLDILQSLFGFLVTILVVVSVHEYGHLLMARLCGVQVLRYSIGFGSPILRWQSGRSYIEYVLAPIPLGGYVMLYGQSDIPRPLERKRAKAKAKAQAQEGEREGQPADAGEPGEESDPPPLPPYSYAAKPVPLRMLIASGGPLFNFILSGVLLFFLIWSGYGNLRPVLKAAPGTQLHQQGVRAGDEVVAVNGKHVNFAGDLALGSISPIIEDGLAVLTIRSRETGESFEVRLAHIEEEGREGFLQDGLRRELQVLGPPASVGSLHDLARANGSPLRRGDRILSIDGTPIGDFYDLQAYVRPRPQQPLNLVVERDGARLALELTSASDPARPEVGLLGISADSHSAAFREWRDWMRPSPRLIDLPGMALDQLWGLFELTVRSLKWLVLGQVSIDNIKGPVGIADYAGASIERGWQTFLYFVALVSVSIGVFNLLPVPVLDGGHILLLCYEAIMDKTLPVRAENVLNTLGIALLGSLIVFTIVNDILSLL